jgi:hypothetical protein
VQMPQTEQSSSLRWMIGSLTNCCNLMAGARTSRMVATWNRMSGSRMSSPRLDVR